MSAYKIGKIIKKDARTGEIVTIYPNVQIAAREEGVTERTVYGWCNGSKKATKYRFESEKVKTLTETICWGCSKACGHCSWSKEFKPVDGWDATLKTCCARQTEKRDTSDISRAISFTAARSLNRIRRESWSFRG